MGIPENIDALLLRYDINQEALARIVGVSQAAVSGWRHNKRPSNANVKKICTYFGLEPNDILSDTYGLAAQERGEVIKRPGRPMAASEPAFLPLLRIGTMHSGDPDECYEQGEEVMVPAEVVQEHPNAFVMRNNGNCMDKVILDGMDGVIDPDIPPKRGDPALVQFEGGETALLLPLQGHGCALPQLPRGVRGHSDQGRGQRAVPGARLAGVAAGGGVGATA